MTEQVTAAVAWHLILWETSERLCGTGLRLSTGGGEAGPFMLHPTRLGSRGVAPVTPLPTHRRRSWQRDL